MRLSRLNLPFKTVTKYWNILKHRHGSKSRAENLTEFLQKAQHRHEFINHALLSIKQIFISEANVINEKFKNCSNE